MENSPSSSPINWPPSSSRFFFMPSSTKSLVEEEEEEALGRTYLSWKDSEKVTMVAKNPYEEFKRSMGEMVEAYGIRELAQLKELMRCYLRLNQRKNHKAIVHAFVDLLADLDTDVDLVADDESRCSYSSSASWIN